MSSRTGNNVKTMSQEEKQKKNALRHEGATAPPAPKKKDTREPYAYENFQDKELEQYCEWLRLKDIWCGDDETLKEFKAFKTLCENDRCETEYPFCTNDKCFFQTDDEECDTSDDDDTFDQNCYQNHTECCESGMYCEEPYARGDEEYKAWDDDNGAWDEYWDEYLARMPKKQ